MDQEQSISASELRNRLYDTFKHSGVENALKAQLRIQLVRILKKKALTPNVSIEAPLVNRAINSLFIDYLQHNNFQYTLSVFLPESNMSSQVLSRVDVLNVLHLEGDSKLLQNMKYAAESEHISESLLLLLFKEIGKLHPTRMDKDVQTDTPPETLDKKLRHLEDDFFMRSEAERTAPYRSLEERMLKYQRDCDERAKMEIQTEITRFKEVELSRMRLEESGKFRELLNREREELEKRFNEKLEKLRQREQDLTENLQKKEQDVLKLDYDQRQKMIRDMEVIKAKENDFRREKEMFAKEMRMSQERFSEREESLNARLDEAHKIVDTMRTKFEADFELYKANYQKSLDDERNSVQRERTLLMDEMKRFEKDKEPHSKVLEKMWRMEDEAKVQQQRLKVSNDHCEHLTQRLKQMQDEVDRLTLISHNLHPAKTAQIAVDQQEVGKLRALLQQSQEEREKIARDYNRMRESQAEHNNGLEELQALHEQELQDLIDDHKKAMQHEKNKAVLLEQEVQREKQRLKDELRKEADIRNDLSRMLDDRELELSRLKLQFGLPPVPMPYIPGRAFLPPDQFQMDARYGMSPVQYSQPKFDPLRPHAQDLPPNFHIPPPPKEQDSWQRELNKTLNGIFQLEKEDMRVQQKYYDVKSSTPPKKDRKPLYDDERQSHSRKLTKSGKEEKSKEGKEGKSGKAKDKKDKEGKNKTGKGGVDEDKENVDDNFDDKKTKDKHKKTPKKSKTDADGDEESEDEIDRKLREMEQREKDEKQRMEREKKEREERQQKEKEEFDRREREIREKEAKLKEDQEKQRQELERQKLEQELSVLRKMKEEEEERRNKEKREREEAEQRRRQEEDQRIRQEDDRRRQDEERRNQEDMRKKQPETDKRSKEMIAEAERREREEKKAQEILSQIRDRREKEQKKQAPSPKLERPKSNSSLSDLDFGEVADILDDDTFSS